MSTQRQAKMPAAKVPQSLGEFFQFSSRRAPEFLEYSPIEEIDRRALRPGEMMRLTAMLRGDAYREGDAESQETRCAAAYAAVKMGLVCAIPVLERALSRDIEDPVVKSALMYALESLRGMAARETAPCEQDQLINLLRMRNSAIQVERRFADIILEKAAIMYGTITSW